MADTPTPRPEPDLLSRYLRQERAEAFAWGSGNRDCMLFVAGWVRCVAGVDFAAPWRDTYSTEAESVALLDELGGYQALLSHFLGEPAPAGEAAQRGDVGLLVHRDGATGLICTGKMWAAKARRGGVALGTMVPTWYWRINLCPTAAANRF
jgi:hypothetical protein